MQEETDCCGGRVAWWRYGMMPRRSPVSVMLGSDWPGVGGISCLGGPECSDGVVGYGKQLVGADGWPALMMWGSDRPGVTGSSAPPSTGVHVRAM
ncbi:hypothetical protein E2C01_090612 [Portunus trituberculatus]|uniref:Uncharacterized protein n=1 Tax=Portunus trituberculatus TaxID=210409 RepID=A0A5B7JH11_PORTR|nr:hypothetical protein [Portunus trituberculatus]